MSCDNRALSCVYYVGAIWQPSWSRCGYFMTSVLLSFTFYATSAYNKRWSYRRPTSSFVLSNDNTECRQNQHGFVVQRWCWRSHLSVREHFGPKNFRHKKRKKKLSHEYFSNLVLMFVESQWKMQRPGRIRAFLGPVPNSTSNRMWMPTWIQRSSR